MSDCTGPHTSVFDCPEHSPTRPAPERTEGEGDDRCDRCAGKPDAECRVLCFQCWTEYVPDPRERAASGPSDAGGRDALWREYAIARTDLINAERDLRDCAVRAAEHRYPPASACQDYLRRADEAWYRLDAAVRALAAAPPAEPQPLDLMVALRDFLRRREMQERIARALVRRHGTPPENDDDTWYPGDRWLEEADDLLRLAAAPPAEPAAESRTIIIPKTWAGR